MQANSLHSQEVCPLCKHAFISGYDPQGKRKCPECGHKFMAKKKCGCDAKPVNKKTPTGSHNIHYADGCPALMSDGRFLTYYNSSNELTDAIRNLNGFQNPNDFRRFLQEHGMELVQKERDTISRENRCYPQVACGRGWDDLWRKYQGDWSNLK